MCLFHLRYKSSLVLINASRICLEFHLDFSDTNFLDIDLSDTDLDLLDKDFIGLQYQNIYL